MSVKFLIFLIFECFFITVNSLHLTKEFDFDRADNPVILPFDVGLKETPEILLNNEANPEIEQILEVVNGVFGSAILTQEDNSIKVDSAVFQQSIVENVQEISNYLQLNENDVQNVLLANPGLVQVLEDATNALENINFENLIKDTQENEIQARDLTTRNVQVRDILSDIFGSIAGLAGNGEKLLCTTLVSQTVVPSINSTIISYQAILDSVTLSSSNNNLISELLVQLVVNLINLVKSELKTVQSALPDAPNTICTLVLDSINFSNSSTRKRREIQELEEIAPKTVSFLTTGLLSLIWAVLAPILNAYLKTTIIYWVFLIIDSLIH